ncbi:IS110 family transposase [Patescibacteria group bacterium]|nr:IS110 family transposase [Patescibacteria group bacterium]
MNKYVGIDMAKADFWACFNEASEPRKFLNNNQGIGNFLTVLKKNNYQKQETLLGVESTGGYHLRLCFDCKKSGYKINVMNPLIVKKQSQTSLRSVKTDKKDALLIRYCLTTGTGYEFSETTDSVVLKSLVRQRDNLSAIKLKLRLQQNEIVNKEECLKRKINSVYQEVNETLTQKIKELEKKLKEYRKEEQALLRTIPGVGPITAISFISELGSIDRFKKAKKLTAYVGIDPRVHESGTSVKGKSYITKRGNKILRTRLYNAASVAVQRPNLFQDFFQKKISEGKPYRVALVATMNKMAHVIHAVWTRGTPLSKKRKLAQSLELVVHGKGVDGDIVSCTM